MRQCDASLYEKYRKFEKKKGNKAAFLKKN